MDILHKAWDLLSMDCGVYVFISKCFPKKSAADQLGEVFSAVVYSPGIALTAICILYVIILFLMMPYYAISNIITVPGAWILFGFSVVMLCRFVARCMMFPGALLPVQKDLAKEMIRGTAFQVSNTGKMVQDFAVRLNMMAKNASQGLKYLEAISIEELERLHEFQIPYLLKIVETGSDEDSTCPVEERAAYKSLTADQLAPICRVREALLNLQKSLSSLLALFVSSDESTINEMPTKHQVRQKVSLKSILMSDARVVLFKRSAQLAQMSFQLRKMAVEWGTIVQEKKSSGPTNHVTNICNSLKAFYFGCEGMEKLAFPMMRKQLSLLYLFKKETSVDDSERVDDQSFDSHLEKYETAVERFSVRANESCISSVCDTLPTLIDGIIIRGSKTSRVSEYVPFGKSLEKNAQPIILYCPPNAGFYECIAMTPVESSWAGVYTQVLGFDLCVFNYRGYGNSTGTPDPSVIKSDGVEVAEFLLGRYPHRKLLVHGESIGGMVACHVARHLGSNLSGLICDKSFSSLNAVSRRMLGNWAGASLALLGRWDTDSIDNYFHIKPGAFKVVMQDPDDEIIHHSSSMKVGIAGQYLMNEDGHSVMPSLDHKYIVADALGFPVPAVSSMSEELYSEKEAEALLRSLEGENFVSMFCRHHSAWTRRLSALLVYPHLPLCVFSEHEVMHHLPAEVPNTEVSLGHMTRDGAQISFEFVQHFAACVISVARRASSAFKANAKMKDAMCPESILSPGFGSESRQHVHKKQVDVENQASNGFESITSSDSERTSQYSNDEAAECQCEKSHGTPSRSKFHRLEIFCNQNIEDKQSMSWEERVWLALARIEGGSGTLLGSCVRGGIDSVKAWILSVVMWGNELSCLNHFSTVLPKSRTDLLQACSEIKALLEEKQHTVGLYNADCDMNDVEASVAETMVLRTADPEFDSVDDTLLFLLRAMQALHYKQISVAAELRGGLDCTENRYREAGKLLNVHNGHNGWIGDEALHQFLHHIVSQLSVHSNAGQDQSISEKADAY